MAELNPLVAMRVALGDGAEWARTLTRRGADLADRLLGLVVRRGDTAPPLADLDTGVPDGPHAAIESAKYHLGSDVVLDSPAGGRDALPATYGHDRLRLLPRDPWTAFVHWEITGPTRARALAILGAAAAGARLVLRLRDVAAAGSAPTFDVELAPGSTSAYVTLPRPSSSWRAELGMRTGDRFVPLGRPDSVTLPAASPTEDATVHWVTLEPRPRPLATAVGRSGPLLDDDSGPRF